MVMLQIHSESHGSSNICQDVGGHSFNLTDLNGDLVIFEMDEVLLATTALALFIVPFMYVHMAIIKRGGSRDDDARTIST